MTKNTSDSEQSHSQIPEQLYTSEHRSICTVPFSLLQPSPVSVEEEGWDAIATEMDSMRQTLTHSIVQHVTITNF